jgi:hypothetical protein
MAKTNTPVRLELEDQDMTLEEVTGIAAAVGLTLDQWISRSVVEYTRQTALHLSSPDVQAFFDQHIAHDFRAMPSTALH